MKRATSPSAVLVFLALVWPKADDSFFNLGPLHAAANWEVGEIESFGHDFHSGEVGGTKQVLDQTEVWFLEEANVAKFAQVFLGVGGTYFFFPPGNANNFAIGQRPSFGITDAHADLDLWRLHDEDHRLLLRAGVFNFKYDENVKDLGEYMFRTYTYPNTIYTGGLVLLNNARTQLNGLDANCKIVGFENDLLLTVKTDQVPSRTLSLTDLVSYNYHKILTVGGGLMFDNLYDPTEISNGTQVITPPYTDYYVLSNGEVILGQNYLPPGSTVVDQGHYTFRGEKLMLRGTVNMGKLLSHPVFSDKDFLIYSEGVVLGLKDYPGFYDKFWQRALLMIGFNIPTFGLLDLLSIETEYSNNPYSNDTYHAESSFAPIPFTSNGGFINTNGHVFKWMAFAQKHLGQYFTITGQVANDHLREIDYFGNYSTVEILPLRKNWYWAFQFSYSN